MQNICKRTFLCMWVPEIHQAISSIDGRIGPSPPPSSCKWSLWCVNWRFRYIWKDLWLYCWGNYFQIPCRSTQNNGKSWEVTKNKLSLGYITFQGYSKNSKIRSRRKVLISWWKFRYIWKLDATYDFLHFLMSDKDKPRLSEKWKIFKSYRKQIKKPTADRKFWLQDKNSDIWKFDATNAFLPFANAPFNLMSGEDKSALESYTTVGCDICFPLFYEWFSSFYVWYWKIRIMTKSHSILHCRFDLSISIIPFRYPCIL